MPASPGPPSVRPAGSESHGRERSRGCLASPSDRTSLCCPSSLSPCASWPPGLGLSLLRKGQYCRLVRAVQSQDTTGWQIDHRAQGPAGRRGQRRAVLAVCVCVYPGVPPGEERGAEVRREPGAQGPARTRGRPSGFRAKTLARDTQYLAPSGFQFYY